MATEILRPNGAGNQQQWDAEGGSYTAVDEASSDGDTTRLYTPTDNRVATFALANSTGLGVINSVTVHINIRGLDPIDNTVQLALRTAGTDYFSSNKVFNNTSYHEETNTWATNPNTSSAWTWAQIDALEAGMKRITGGGQAVTQVWVVVDYTPATATQEGFRWRYDNGSETLATWIASQDTNISRLSSQNTRLRVLLDTSGDAGEHQYQLEYKEKVSGSWTPLSNAPLVTLESNDFSSSISEFNVASGTWGISGGVLQTTAGAGGAWQDGVLLTDDTSFDDFNLLVKVRKASFNTQIIFRSGTTTGSGYGIQLRGTDTFRLENWGASNLEEDATLTLTEGDWYWVRIICVGTNIKARIWDDGDSEPATWNIDYTGSEHSSGGIGFSREGATGTAEFDSLTVVQDGTDIYVSPSTHITASGEATTALLTPPSGKSTSDFDAGRIQDDENPTDAITVSSDDYTELEWSIGANDSARGFVYQFRVTKAGVALNTYSVTPEWTVGLVLDTADGRATSNATSQTDSVAVASGVDRRFVATVLNNDASSAGAESPTGVTYDGVALVKTKEQAGSASDNTVSFWELPSPNVGTANLVVSFASQQDFIDVAWSVWQGATQSPLGYLGTAQESMNTQNPSIAVDNYADGAVVISAGYPTNSPAGGTITGATEFMGTYFPDAGYSTNEPIGTVTHTYAGSAGTEDWILAMVVIPPSVSSMSSFFDDFNDNSRNVALWDAYTASSGVVTETNSRLEFALAPTTSGSWAGYNSVDMWALKDGERAFVEVGSVSGGNTWLDITLALEPLPDNDNFLFIGVNTKTGKLEAGHQIVGSDTILASIDFNATTHKYIGIYRDGNDIYFQYSANGNTWSNLYPTSGTLALPISVDNVYVILDDYEQDALASPSTHVLDGFNIIPDVPDTANSERDAHITGTATSNSERDAHLIGQSTSSSERDAKTIGTASTNSARSAKTTGELTTNSERDARLIGNDTEASERDAHMIGTDTSSSERDAHLTGNSASNSERDAKMTGTSTSNSERDAHMVGTDTSSSERGAKVTGDGGTAESRDAKVTGTDTASSERDAHIVGQDTISSVRGAKTDGIDTTYSERDAHIVGTDTASSEHDAKMTGTNTDSDEKDAKITGTQNTNSERDAHIVGTDTASSDRNALITGSETDSSSRGARITGDIIPVETSSSRGARLIGTGQWYTDDPKTFSSSDPKNWYTDAPNDWNNDF